AWCMSCRQNRNSRAVGRIGCAELKPSAVGLGAPPSLGLLTAPALVARKPQRPEKSLIRPILSPLNGHGGRKPSPGRCGFDRGRVGVLTRRLVTAFYGRGTVSAPSVTDASPPRIAGGSQ